MSDVKKKRVSAAEFVTVWQSAETMTEVCENLEMKPGTAQVRASTYRKKGVLLKKFAKGGKSFDVNALNELIADIEAPVLGNVDVEVDVDVDVDTPADEEAAA
jgi:hypothetical protein